MAFELPPGADPSKIPMMLNPSGDAPNFVNPPSQATISIGVGLPMTILAFFAVTLRLFSNWRNTRNGALGVDDYLCLAGFIFMTTYFSVGLTMSHVNRHTWDIPLSFLTPDFAKKIFVFNLLASPSIMIPKIAILVLYTRLFTVERWIRYLSWTTIAVLVLYCQVLICTTMASCAPVGGVWMVRNECGSTITIVSVVGGAIAVATDLIIFFIPLPVVLKLNLDPRKKLGLIVVFMTGILAVVCGIVSLHYRIWINNASDKLWNAAVVQACAFAEGYITLIVSCTPAIYSLWTNQIIKSGWYSSLRSFARSSASESQASNTTVEYKSNPYKSNPIYSGSFDSNSTKRPDALSIDLPPYLGNLSTASNSLRQPSEENFPTRPMAIQKSTTIRQERDY